MLVSNQFGKGYDWVWMEEIKTTAVANLRFALRLKPSKSLICESIMPPIFADRVCSLSEEVGFENQKMVSAKY